MPNCGISLEWHQLQDWHQMQDLVRAHQGSGWQVEASGIPRSEAGLPEAW